MNKEIYEWWDSLPHSLGDKSQVGYAKKYGKACWRLTKEDIENIYNQTNK